MIPLRTRFYVLFFCRIVGTDEKGHVYYEQRQQMPHIINLLLTKTVPDNQPKRRFTDATNVSAPFYAWLYHMRDDFPSPITIHYPRIDFMARPTPKPTSWTP